MAPDAIPTFFLYGEAPKTVGDRFLHLESLDDRTRPSNWNIRPHAHANLNHVFYISDGGGEMRADAHAIAFTAPCLLLVPARIVHGFHFETETHGSVLTISEGYLRDLIGREPEFAPLFAAPSTVALTATRAVNDSLDQLGRELAWTAPGHAAAVEALLVRLLVTALRMSRPAEAEQASGVGAPARLVARFREMVEARYRADTRVETYAEALSVTPRQLRSACLKAAHLSPIQILQDRLLLEAKRLMLYSNMTVAEAAYYLGFSDPAYFSRFFAKGAGRSPRAFRTEALQR